VDRGYPNMTELTYELPEVVRWRNFLLGERASRPCHSIRSSEPCLQGLPHYI